MDGFSKFKDIYFKIEEIPTKWKAKIASIYIDDKVLE